MYQYINLASVIVLLLLVYLALQRFSPILPGAYEPGINKDELRQRYRQFTRWLTGGFLLTWVFLTFAINWLLDALITLRLSFLYDVLYIVPPDYRIVQLNAACISFLISFFVFWRIAYFRVLTSWEEYQQFINLYFRFDIVRYARHFTRVLTLFTVLLTLLVFDWYTTFGDEEIKANDLIGLGTRKYEYNSIVEVKDVKKRENLLGDIIDKPFCVMTFEDQYKWKNLFIGHDEKEKILNLVMARAHVYRQEQELEGD
jgi:hypothetical protein